MPLMSSPYEAVVAQYHEAATEDFSEDNDDENDGLVSGYHHRRPATHHRVGLWTKSKQESQSFAMNEIFTELQEDEDVAAAKAELDGLRRPQRPYNPLTIIQIKNAERNLDNSQHDGCTFEALRSRRRLCLTTAFVALGLVMVGVVVVWAAPDNCQNQMMCRGAEPSALPNRHRRNAHWVISYDNITLTSGLEVVEAGGQGLVVSGFSSAANHRAAASGSFGLLALRPEDGRELWRHHLQAKPQKHDCNLVDLNEDGVNDCLVVGDGGLLTAIDPITGKEIWYMRYHMPLVNISLPRRLPDLDGDRVSELIAACAVTFPSEMNDNHAHIRTNFILVSGRLGRVMGRPYLVDSCTDIGALNVTSNLALQFDCTSRHGADQFEMSLDELYSKATNQPSKDFALTEGLAGRAAMYRQFDVIGDPASQTVKDSIHLDWSPLKPACPECGVTVKLWDGFAHRLLWNQTWPRAVAFHPLSTRFETERPDSPIEGFVFRLWQWSPEDAHYFQSLRTPLTPSTTTTTSTTASASRSAVDDEDDEDIFSLYKNNEPPSYDSSDSQPSGPPTYEWAAGLLPFGRPSSRGLLSFSKNSVDRKNSLVDAAARKKQVLNVSETIYYVTLNHSTPQVIPLFTHTLGQECNVLVSPYQCQPHYNTMPNSMVILEHSSGGPNWRDLVVATTSLAQDEDWQSKSRRLTTSLHRLRLSKDIRSVVP